MREKSWLVKRKDCDWYGSQTSIVVVGPSMLPLDTSLTAKEQDGWTESKARSMQQPDAIVLEFTDTPPLLSVYKDGRAFEGYTLDVRARQEGDEDAFHVHASVEIPDGGEPIHVIGDGTWPRKDLDWFLYAAARHPARVELDVARARAVWGYVIDGYEATVEYGRYGATGDPRKTVLAALGASGADWADLPTFAEIREVLAIVALIKAHDGRISQSNRAWLAAAQTATASDWYMEWGVKMRRLDEIHSAHIDGIMSAMRLWRAEGAAR